MGAGETDEKKRHCTLHLRYVFYQSKEQTSLQMFLLALEQKVQAYVVNTKITFAHCKFVSQIFQLRK